MGNQQTLRIALEQLLLVVVVVEVVVVGLVDTVAVVVAAGNVVAVVVDMDIEGIHQDHLGHMALVEEGIVVVAAGGNHPNLVHMQ